MKSIRVYLNNNEDYDYIYIFLNGFIFYFENFEEGDFQDYAYYPVQFNPQYRGEGKTSSLNTFLELLYTEYNEIHTVQLIIEDSEFNTVEHVKYSIDSEIYRNGSLLEYDAPADTIKFGDKVDFLIKDIINVIDSSFSEWALFLKDEDIYPYMKVTIFNNEDKRSTPYGDEVVFYIMPWPDTEEYILPLDTSEFIYFYGNSSDTVFKLEQYDIGQYLNEIAILFENIIPETIDLDIFQLFPSSGEKIVTDSSGEQIVYGYASLELFGEEDPDVVSYEYVSKLMKELFNLFSETIEEFFSFYKEHYKPVFQANPNDPKEKLDELKNAVIDYDLEKIEAILPEIKNFYSFYEGRNPFIFEILPYIDVPILKLFLEYGLNLFTRDYLVLELDMDDIFSMAVEKAKVEVVKFLYTYLQSDGIFLHPELLFRALLANADLEVAKLLIDLGVDVNGSDNEDQILFKTVYSCLPLERIKLLVENGADINSTDYDGRTIFDVEPPDFSTPYRDPLTAEKNYRESIEYLKSKKEGVSGV